MTELPTNSKIELLGSEAQTLHLTSTVVYSCCLPTPDPAPLLPPPVFLCHHSLQLLRHQDLLEPRAACLAFYGDSGARALFPAIGDGEDDLR